MSEPTRIPKGALFIISTGEYSDYSVQTICRALVEIDYDILMTEFLASIDWYPGESEYINWLINTKHIAKELDYFEFHIQGKSLASDRWTNAGINERRRTP